MPLNRNLERGQYQLGDTVMGPYTPFKVESIDIGNYDLNVQDTQNQMSNEIVFGQDTLKPASLQMTINVLANRALPHIAALTNDVRVLDFSDDPNLSDLQREWRAEETLMNWGVIKPLLFCGSDGIVRQFFGRPGKFTYKKHKQIDSLYYQCQAEFRRSDTFAYSDTEFYVDFYRDVPQTITRVNGNASSWVRFFLVGPFTHPVINFGSRQIEIDTTHPDLASIYPGGLVPEGVSIEISSYPWERRVVDSNGISLAAYIVTDRPYLDTIKFPANNPTVISWTAAAWGDETRMRLMWHDAYQVMD